MAVVVARGHHGRLRRTDASSGTRDAYCSHRRNGCGRARLRGRVLIVRNQAGRTPLLPREAGRARRPLSARAIRPGGRMRAVILAAGRGGRLRGVAGARPKCLARVGARTLIERQIQALRACGADEIAVVAGYRAAEVRAACGAGIDVVHNARYASTNSLYSLWLARHLL